MSRKIDLTGQVFERLTVAGVSRTIAEWADVVGVDASAIYMRRAEGRADAVAVYGVRRARAMGLRT